MIIILNALHTQRYCVEENVPFAVVKRTHALKNAMDIVDEYTMYENEPIVLAGFIYNDRDMPQHLKERVNVYYVSDIGTLPTQLETVTEDKKHYSLLHQICELFKDSREVDIPVWLEESSKRDTEWFNMKSFEKSLLPKDEKVLDLLKEKSYNKGNVYLIYENDPMNKILLAHHILDELDKGIVIVGSQTRSDNDILTFYCRGINTEELAHKFGVECSPYTNIFNVFMRSQINQLGTDIIKFIQGRN